ncbi:unnamed protein product, partial [Prorocentrum cordatum]
MPDSTVDSAWSGLEVRGQDSDVPDSSQTLWLPASLANERRKHRGEVWQVSEKVMDPAERARAVAEGKLLLGFAVELARMQIAGGRFFAFEHPK